MPSIPVAVGSKQLANHILAALPREEYERLARHLKPVSLRKGQIICNVGDAQSFVYFVSSGLISLLLVTLGGETFEVAMIGCEGVAGVPAILGAQRMPFSMIVRTQGEILQAPAASLKAEFTRGGHLQYLVLGYTHSLLVQVAQIALCNRFHPLEQRLARWLLLTRDAVGSTTLHLTHEFISQMLGTQRTLVTAAARTLQEAGLIRYHYRRISILNSEGLEADACECYQIVRQELKRICDPQAERAARGANPAA